MENVNDLNMEIDCDLRDMPITIDLGEKGEKGEKGEVDYDKVQAYIKARVELIFGSEKERITRMEKELQEKVKLQNWSVEA
ncbi:hypothetical protein [uncultured Megasphaera sp.]|jgi:hypothetical protein|uniref:hypothetical protein n=1 Tax=uncultured Megasphaera sp. TaxID=165188 RepID=UPI0020547A58|nr:hypothetical protein [uncultured Megasphaera sp.]DAK32665.1 MAG TPA: hypothetical protein [Caudoviricetes sp.]